MSLEFANTNSKINQDERYVDRDCNKTNAIPTCIHYRCARNNISIIPFVHSPEGKALVLTVHSRETRNFSRETRLVSRETRRVSRDGGNLHLGGTVYLSYCYCIVFEKPLRGKSIKYVCMYVVVRVDGVCCLLRSTDLSNRIGLGTNFRNKHQKKRIQV